MVALCFKRIGASNSVVTLSKFVFIYYHMPQVWYWIYFVFWLWISI